MDEILISRKIEIDMGHRVPQHKSKCRNLHGHRYVFEAGVRGPLIVEQGASDEGMVMDYGDIKEIMVREIHDPLDHGFMMYDGDPLREAFAGFADQRIIFVPFIPTAENIARYAHQKMQPHFEQKGLNLAYVKVWETPNSTAMYPALA